MIKRPTAEELAQQKVNKEAFENAQNRGIRINKSVTPGLSDLALLFQKFPIEEHIADYLSSDFRDDINAYIDTVHLRTRGLFEFWSVKHRNNVCGTFEYFANQTLNRGRREQEQSPFSEKDALALKESLNHHHDIALTMIAMHSAIGSYFNKIGAYYDQSSDRTPDYLDRFLQNANLAGGFFGEVLPHILYTLHQDDTLKNNPEKLYSNGLKQSFISSAWKSDKENKNDGFALAPGNNSTHCPFSKFVTNIWRTVYEADEKGDYRATVEKRDGALPTTFAKRIQELEQTKPSIKMLKL